MEKFNCLVDSTFNLLKASEKNQSEIEGAIQGLEKSSNTLRGVSQNIESRVYSAVDASSRKSAEYITKKILSELSEAKNNANVAAARFEMAARFSILKIGSMFFLFFLMAGALLWFMFIKNIPTIDEINQLRNEKSTLEKEIDSLRQYGNISHCGGKPCIQVDPSVRYSEEKMPYFIIIPKQ